MRTAASLKTIHADKTPGRPDHRVLLFLSTLRRTASLLEGRVAIEERLHGLRDPARASTSLPVRRMRRRLKALQATIRRIEAA